MSKFNTTQLLETAKHSSLSLLYFCSKYMNKSISICKRYRFFLILAMLMVVVYKKQLRKMKRLIVKSFKYLFKLIKKFMKFILSSAVDTQFIQQSSVVDYIETRTQYGLEQPTIMIKKQNKTQDQNQDSECDNDDDKDHKRANKDRTEYNDSCSYNYRDADYSYSNNYSANECTMSSAWHDSEEKYR